MLYSEIYNIMIILIFILILVLILTNALDIHPHLSIQVDESLTPPQVGTGHNVPERRGTEEAQARRLAAAV